MSDSTTAETIRQLGIARKALIAYPPAHPELAAALERAHRPLAAVLDSVEEFAFAAARDGLLWGGETVDTVYARELASALLERQAGVVRLSAGLDVRELEAFLRCLAPDAARSERPGLAEELSSAGATHVRVEALDYSRIVVTDRVDASRPQGVTFEEIVLSALEPSRAPTPPPDLSASESAAVPETVAHITREFAELYGQEDVERVEPLDLPSRLGRARIRVPRSARTGPSADLGDRPETVSDEAIAYGQVWALIELLDASLLRSETEMLLERSAAGFRLLIQNGRLAAAVEIAGALRDRVTGAGVAAGTVALINECLERFASPEAMAALIDHLPAAGEPAFGQAKRLVGLLGTVALRNLLLALADEEDQSRRRRLVDFLTALGPAIVPEAVLLLKDERWYVVRNVLLLLRSVDDRSSLPQIREVAEHEDLRVRLEAIKSLLAHDPKVPRELLARTLQNPDPKLAERAIALAGSYGILEAVDPLVKLLRRWDPLGQKRSLRLRAIWALGEFHQARALAPLGRYFEDWILPLVALEERRAMFQTLGKYPEAARRPYVEKGLKSRDPEIQEICRKLAIAKRPSERTTGGPDSAPVR
jgi:HEAT repeat protein